MLTSLEICAGAGGQALGLERAGFEHAGLVEIDAHACATLRLNRPGWNVVEGDVRAFDGRPFRGVDLLAGGVPCPPFSKAGQQRGRDDERDLFPEALRLVEEVAPRAVMLENVRGLLDDVFDDYRQGIEVRLQALGYRVGWRLLHASSFGVAQLRPRVVLVALRQPWAEGFRWPRPMAEPPPSVGEVLYDLVQEHGWAGAAAWRLHADQLAPTIVGGSKKHGGPDRGPTRAKKAWAALGVDGHGVADVAPAADFIGRPRLTVRMVARLQGFPDDWQFYGSKTHAYRQVGNTFPPPVAEAVGRQVRAALEGGRMVFSALETSSRVDRPVFSASIT